MHMFTLMEWLAKPTLIAQRTVRSDSDVQLASMVSNRERFVNAQVGSAQAHRDQRLPPPNTSLKVGHLPMPETARRQKWEALIAVFNQDVLDCEIAVRVGTGSADHDGENDFSSVRLSEPTHLCGFNVRLSESSDDLDAIHLVSSVFTG